LFELCITFQTKIKSQILYIIYTAEEKIIYNFFDKIFID
jgi:hypothetical protein